MDRTAGSPGSSPIATWRWLWPTRLTPGRLTLDQVMSRPVHTCRSDDHRGVALDRMAAFHVRRLPVVDVRGDVKGLISIDDIVLSGLRSPGVSTQAVVAALRALASASSFAAREYAETNQPSR